MNNCFMKSSHKLIFICKYQSRGKFLDCSDRLVLKWVDSEQTCLFKKTHFRSLEFKGFPSRRVFDDASNPERIEQATVPRG